jgi:predicted acylesterase/phospholipase RssA
VPESLLHWVHDQEVEHRLLVFQCEAGASEWARFALRQSDLVLLVGEHNREAAPRDWESQLGLLDARSNLRRVLLLLQPDDSEEIRNTADWLAPRQLDFHLHVRGKRKSEVARVARVVSGEATGLVLGAGASRGFAHLGVYRALMEAGKPIDWIGGTSIGAIMGAMMAMDWSPEQCIAAARRSFVGSKPFSDFTLPMVSLLAGRRMRRLLRAQADRNIEDLPLPFFCISSNLDNGTPNLHQDGNLARALEATASMPGIFPPSVVNQRLAVDGSVLNSLPVDLMWQQPVGRVIASDLAAQLSRTVDYEEVPSVWRLLRSNIFRLGKRYRVPGLMNVMLKSTELATLQNVRAQGQRASLLLQPDVRRFGLTRVSAFDEIVEEGYRYTAERLQAD